jgi:hypothetical protein
VRKGLALHCARETSPIRWQNGPISENGPPLHHLNATRMRNLIITLLACFALASCDTPVQSRSQVVARNKGSDEMPLWARSVFAQRQPLRYRFHLYDPGIFYNLAPEPRPNDPCFSKIPFTRDSLSFEMQCNNWNRFIYGRRGFGVPHYLTSAPPISFHQP